MSLVLALLLAVPISLAARAAGAQDTGAAPRWAAAVDSLVRAEMARAGVPGAQIAVVQGGRVIYSKGYGVADIESGRPVTERTLFHVGSVTKTVTATLLAQLAAEGKVDLHAPIARYVPELAGRKVGEATTHQLLTHTAGWADAIKPYAGTDESALGRVLSSAGDTLLLTEPGRVFSYSNPGFAMAGYVAERVTGTPFVDLADRMVLRKLGMPRATFRPTVAMTHDFSLGHVPPRGGTLRVQRPMPVNAAEYPAGFLYASAAEIARLELALMGGGMLDGERVLAPEAIRTMTTGAIRIPGSPRNWSGYGLHVDTVGGQPVWRKNGSVDGYASQIDMWPDLGVGVASSTNRAVPLPARINVLVAQLVSGRRLEPDPAPPARAATAEERRSVIGRYRVGRGNTTVEIAEVDGALQWRGTRLTFPIRMVSADELVGDQPEQGPTRVNVVRDASGRVLYLSVGAHAYVKVP